MIDAGWRFQLGDHLGAEQVHYDDGSWQQIGLPHSFGLPYFASSHFYVGYGWYRKHITIARLLPSQRIALDFGAAFQDAQVFVNGKEVGRHEGGYTGFSFDITSQVVPGDNVIAVRLNNLWNPRLNPRAGEHNFNGGIYRDVSLVTTSDLRVDWYGTFVTTPGLSANGSTVHIATDVRNSSAGARTFTLQTEIVDGHGKIVTIVSSRATAGPNSVVTVQQDTPFVSRPDLWSPEHPTMYTAVSEITEGSRKDDTYRTPFGFRWFNWTSEQGFFLNGKHLYFHGADVHQDHAGWGDGVTDSGIVRDVRMMKQAGFDFIRGSHYPHSPVFADECDRQGILFWSENSFWGTGGIKKEGGWTASAYPPNPADQKAFEESVERSLEEMIRINRNHPSIIAWSMGNEVFFSDANLMPKVRAFLGELVALTHRLDPGRPAAIGGVQRGNLDKIGDVAGYNGDGATLFIDPGVPNAVTEYGSPDEGPRPGSYAPKFDELAEQPEFEWRSGQAIWSGFDHGSIFGRLGTTGIVDYFRLPKRAWYWYRNAYQHVPPPAWPINGTPAALQIHTDLPVIEPADGRGDIQVIVQVVDAQGRQVSAAPPVDLKILSGPGQFPTGRSIEFRHDSDIDIREGEAAIELRSYYSGQIVVRATSAGLTSATLTISARGGPRYVPGRSSVVSDRPYVAPVEAPLPLGGAATTNLALDRPTAASSELPGHSSALTNDGDANTAWTPQPPDVNPWWQVDFESICSLDSATFRFIGGAAPQIHLEISDDGRKWTPLTNTVESLPSPQVARITFTTRTISRFLRIYVQGKSPKGHVSLADVDIEGRPFDQH